MAAVAGPGGALVDVAGGGAGAARRARRARARPRGRLERERSSSSAAAAGAAILPYEIVDSATVLDVAAVRAGTVALPDAGAVVLLDPIGGPIAVALAEELGERAVLVTQDNIAGNELVPHGGSGAGQRPAAAARRASSSAGRSSVRSAARRRTARPRTTPRRRRGRGRGPLQRRPPGDRRGRGGRLRLPAAGHAAARRDASSGRLRGAPHDPRGDPGGTASGDRARSRTATRIGRGFAAGTTGAPHRPEDMP